MTSKAVSYFLTKVPTDKVLDNVQIMKRTFVKMFNQPTKKFRSLPDVQYVVILYEFLYTLINWNIH